MRKGQKPPEPEDRRLQSVLYCIRGGLRKLVPCGENYGAPPFTKYGASNSEWDAEHYDEKAQGYLTAHLHAWYAPVEKGWVCCITIQDGDDFIFQRFREFTWKDWCEQVDLYNQLDGFDHDIHALLQQEGFD